MDTFRPRQRVFRPIIGTALASVLILLLLSSCGDRSSGPMAFSESEIRYMVSDSVSCHSSISSQLCAELNEALDDLQGAEAYDSCEQPFETAVGLRGLLGNGKIRYDSNVPTAKYDPNNDIIILGLTTLDDHYAKVFNMTHEFSHREASPGGNHDCENWLEPECGRPDGVDEFSRHCGNTATGEDRQWEI